MTALHTDDLELLERLGGGEAVVHRAMVRTTGRVVVTKHAPWDRADVSARLGREADILRRVQHPSLVQLLHTIEDEQGRTLVLAHAPGGSLATRIAVHGTLPVGEVADTGARLALALAALHRRGVVHRDVHPGNVLIDAELQPLLADLDHALDQQGGHLPSDAEVVGHRDHVDPRCHAGGPQGPACDLHALATTLWTAATGAPPARTGPEQAVRLPGDERVPPALLEALRTCIEGGLDAAEAAGRFRAVASELHAPGPTPSPARPPLGPPAPPSTPPSPPRTAPRCQPHAMAVATAETRTRRWGPPPGGLGPAPATPAMGTRGRDRRRLVLAALAVLAVLAVLTVLTVLSLLGPGRSVGSSNDTRRPSAPHTAVPPTACPDADLVGPAGHDTEPVMADLHGEGCSVALWFVDGVLHTPGGSYRVGRTDDVLVAGDWNGDGTWGVGFYRPRTGGVFVFDGPPGPGAGSRAVEPLRAGGTPVVVDDGAGHRVVLVPDG